MLSKSNGGDGFFAFRISCFSETKQVGWGGGGISGHKWRSVLVKSSFFIQGLRAQLKPGIAML